MFAPSFMPSPVFSLHPSPPPCLPTRTFCLDTEQMLGSLSVGKQPQ